jgi:DNA invertase Pin-like site-specific DNA recombinase
VLRAETRTWNRRRPYGYTSDGGKLITVEHEVATARRIFELFLEHPSAMSVREKLRALGITDRKGRRWSSSSIEASCEAAQAPDQTHRLPRPRWRGNDGAVQFR